MEKIGLLLFQHLVTLDEKCVIIIIKGSGCGSFGRAVAPNTRGLWFKSSHRQIVSTINCIEKTNVKKIEAGIGPI